jgi:DNA-binding transcriptional LysR family regulator
VLGAFLSNHPQLSIDLEERLSRDIVQAVTDGVADIGIVSDATDSSVLQTLAFRDDPLVLVMARDHALARQLGKKRSMSFADALAYDFIGLAGDSALQQYAAEQASRLGLRLHCKIRLRSFEAMCRMAASGAGLALLPEAAVARGQAGGHHSADGDHHLRIVKLNDDWAHRKLLICMRDHAALPVYARELVAALRRI